MASLKAAFLAKLISDEYFRMNLLTSRTILDSIYSSKPKTPLQREVKKLIEENQLLALKNSTPVCQDTGVLTLFVEFGKSFSIEGDLRSELHRELVKTTKKRGLRFSTVDCMGRYSNEPSIHFIQSSVKKPRIVMMAKGGGSENLTKMKMFPPSSSAGEIIDFAVKSVDEAQERGCPPYIISVASGLCSDESAVNAKMALTGLFSHNKSEEEKSIANKVKSLSNKLGIGIQGLSFGETVADCRVMLRSRHIACLPITVMFNCFQERVREILL
ncbi:MAG: fumarate hydratase [bacterium]|nr:fumarate hydratase [bacterium]